MWLVRLPDNVKIESLPSLLAKSPCGYEFESECERPIEAAFRKFEPKGVIRDLSTYQPLRPGVALSCGARYWERSFSPHQAFSLKTKIKNNS